MSKTVAEIKKELDALGLPYAKNARKAELVELLDSQSQKKVDSKKRKAESESEDEVEVAAKKTIASVPSDYDSLTIPKDLIVRKSSIFPLISINQSLVQFHSLRGGI